MKKIALGIVVILAVALAVWKGLIPGLDINGLIKEQIEYHGSHTTGTQVALQQVQVDLLKGKGQLNGLTIANPAGYKTANAFAMQTIALDLGTESLDPIVIEELVIAAPTLTFEANQTGGGNLMDIMDNIEKALPAPAAKQPEQQTANQDIPKIAIKKIIIQDVALTLDLTALTLESYQEVLPSVTVENVGTPNGLPANEIGIAVAKKVFKALVDEVKQKQKQKLKDKAKDKLKDKVKDKLKGLLG